MYELVFETYRDNAFPLWLHNYRDNLKIQMANFNIVVAGCNDIKSIGCNILIWVLLGFVLL